MNNEIKKIELVQLPIIDHKLKEVGREVSQRIANLDLIKQIATVAEPSLCLHLETLTGATFALHALAIQRENRSITATRATTLHQTQTRRAAH